MTPDRLRECLGVLNWSTAALAAMAQISPVTARRWQAGKVSIPPDVARVVEQMAALAETLSRKPGRPLTLQRLQQARLNSTT